MHTDWYASYLYTLLTWVPRGRVRYIFLAGPLVAGEFSLNRIF